ncbi:class I SAM-dependent methyltransferase [Patescibacteria group bacterium]|nr:class I SAM-dependent methyltransferase [Patescibacteria group bacterium]
MINKKILDNLICIKCLKRVRFNKKILTCDTCKREYPIINDKLYVIKPVKDSKELVDDFVINRLKTFFKKFPKIYNILYYLFGVTFVGRNSKNVIKNIDEKKIIINLGSGPRKIREDIINVDFYPFTNVHIVADIVNLPFKDNSVDVIINESVLEHIKNPQTIVKEMYRILKPGGLIYVTVPFVVSFHSSPNDYYRWSMEGLRQLFKDYKEIEIDVRGGPTSAMLSIFNDWIATLFSFGSRWLHQILLIIFMIITSPLKIIDYLIYKFPSSQNIAYGFYYIGKKK